MTKHKEEEGQEEGQEEKKPVRRETQAKLEKDQVISDLVIPANQLLVNRGRDFIKTLSEQGLVQTSLPMTAADGSSMKDHWKCDINGVTMFVPVGRVVNVPESVAALIADISR